MQDRKMAAGLAGRRSMMPIYRDRTTHHAFAGAIYPASAVD